MSNRGRHKNKTKNVNITTTNIVYHEIENFRIRHGIYVVTLYLKNNKDGLFDKHNYEISSNITVQSLIEFLNSRKHEGFVYVRVPNAQLVTDRYYIL